MQKLSFILLFSGLIIFASQSQAKEGFNDNMASLPFSVSKWAERTYAVYSEKAKAPVGTAFLVHSESQKLHFVTARHVANHCLETGSCSLRWGNSWPLSMLGKDFTSQINLKIQKVRIFSEDQQDWKGSGPAADMAYIQTLPDPKAAHADIKDLGPSVLSPQQVGAMSCLHWILGYPGLKTRPSLKNSEAAKIVQLLWSEGAIVRKVSSAKKFVIHSDADSLPGNSGGPVITEEGHLLGILYGGPSNYEYMAFPWYFSYIVPIDNVRRLIAQILMYPQGK